MNNDAMQLRLSDVIHALLKNRLLIIALTVIGLGVGIVLSIISYARGEISKEYAINTSIAVTSVTEDGLFTTQSRNPNSTDIYLAENMVDSVIYVIKSDRLLTEAIKRMGLLGISVGDITSNLHVSQYNETQIIEMTLYWRSAEEGVQILSAINSVAPDVLIDTLKIGGVSVVNQPVARYRVGGSVNASLWLYMAVLGMMAGVGFSVLRLLLSPTLVNSRDMETNMGIMVLGEIPSNRRFFSKKRALLSYDPEGVGDDVRESFAAAAHILRSRLEERKKNVFYVTSAAQNEGKTSTAANLALQLSDMEYKVLLVDFDVRNPSLGSVFLEHVEYSRSLNALYRGDTTVEKAITELTGYLDLLPAILEHKDLPLDDAMLDLVRGLAEKYDYVVMDTAPVGRVADPMNLNGISNCALFVVRFDTTGMTDIRDALERLEKSGVDILGCVVNGVKKLGKRSYGYGYSYGYGRSYGRDRKEQPEKQTVPAAESDEA